jgi:uncharacterized membrane protein YheB (UPF0754 family)
LKKTILSLIIIVSIFNLIGCTVSDSAPLVKENASRIDSFPTWISNPPKSSNIYYASANAQEKTFHLSITEAEKKAKNVISQWIEKNVNTIIETQKNQLSSNCYEGLEIFEQFTSQVLKNILSSVTREQLYRANDGTVYVLMRIRMSDIRNAFDRANSTISQNFNEPTEAELVNQKMIEDFENLLIKDIGN